MSTPVYPDHFPFFRLVIELRNAIYELLLVFPDGSIKVKARKYVPTIQAPPNFIPIVYPTVSQKTSDALEAGINLLTACRQSYDEGIAVLYRSNDFHFDSPEAGYRFLKSIGSPGQQCLRSIQITLVGSSGFLLAGFSVWQDWFFQELSLCPSLRKVHLVLDQTAYLSLKGQALDPKNHPASRLRGLKEVKISSSPVTLPFWLVHDSEAGTHWRNGDHIKEKGDAFDAELRRIMMQPKKPLPLEYYVEAALIKSGAIVERSFNSESESESIVMRCPRKSEWPSGGMHWPISAEMPGGWIEFSFPIDRQSGKRKYPFESESPRGGMEWNGEESEEDSL